MYLKIFALFFMQACGFTFQERLNNFFYYRPLITQQQCSVSPNEIEGNLIFFHQIKFLLKSLPDLRDDEKAITQIIDLKQKFGDQSEIIQKGLFDQFQEFSSLRQVIQLEENKAPDDPQVIQCYNNVLILHQKLQKLKDVIKNCGRFYQRSFIDYAKETLVEIQSINTKMIQVKNYKQEDVEKEINQLERDYQICKGHIYSPIQKLQTKFKVLSKNKKEHKIFRQKNRKNQQREISLLQTNWEFEQYEPINYFECKNQQDELKEDFLFFLKIQQIYQHINSKLVQPINNFYKFKDQFLKNNKAIFQAIMSINIKEIAYEKLLNNQYIQNEEQKNINEIHNTFQSYKSDRVNIQNRLKYVQELSILLDDAYYQEINNLYNKINYFISTNFHYQQEDVYNELKQINRDYNICFKENPYEKLIIKYHKRSVTDTKEPLLENLPPELKNQCQELDKIKENILTTYKHLVLIKYHEQERRVFPHEHQKITQLLYLVQPLDLTERIIQFQNFLPNYKPDDVKAIKAYQRFQIINDVLVNLKKNYHNAYYFLAYIDEDYKKIEWYKRQIRDIIGQNKFVLDNGIMMRNLQTYQKEYTQCTGQQFDKVYQIQHESEIPTIKKTQVVLIDQSRPQRLDGNKHKSSFIQYNWTYKDYPKIKESECKNEINEIREDILEFEKIQFLIKYKKSHQKEYNQLISDILAIELDFVETVKLIYLRQEESFQFVKYPRNKDESNDVNFCYNVLEKLDRKINFVNKQAKLAQDFLKFNKVQFSTLRYNNKLLNEYLHNELNYKESDVEKELGQLYRDYEVCRKVPYNKDSEDQKKIVPHILLQQRAQKKQMKKNKVRLRSNKKNKK